MQKVEILLSTEIARSLINWDKLNQKLNAFVEVMKHKNKASLDNGKEITIEDAATFKIRDKDLSGKELPICIKLFELRFKAGDIYCSAIQKGFYDLYGKPTFPFPKDFV